MREIKFRAWDNESGALVENDQLLEDFNISYVFGHPEEERLILMQYTGLKDKNGVEIYEGDIVEAYLDYGPAGERKTKYVVKIGGFGANLQMWTFKEKGYLPKVIGNIYENPEMLFGGDTDSV